MTASPTPASAPTLATRGLIANPANPNFGGTDPNAPYYVKANDIRAAYASEGGLIDSGVLRGTKFDPGGGTSPFTYGANLTDDNTMTAATAIRWHRPTFW